MEDLDSLEIALIKDCNENGDPAYAFIQDHIPYLKVKKRNYTGVGYFASFEYVSGSENLNFPIDFSLNFGSDHVFELDTIKYGIGCVLSIKHGVIRGLEVYTNADPWDGHYNSFTIGHKVIKSKFNAFSEPKLQTSKLAKSDNTLLRLKISRLPQPFTLFSRLIRKYISL